MANWGSWLALIGGVVSVIGQYSTGYYLALVGGVLAVIGGISAMMK